MTDIGVGLIGTGFMGKCHALAYRTVKTVFGNVPAPRLELLCDVDAAVAGERAEAFGFARSTTDWREVIADPAVELVSIATPNALHAEIAIAALEAGRHVWCEKPMALTLDDAARMAAAAARAGSRTALGYNYLCNPALKHARALIRAGAIGEVFDFRGTVDEDYMADADLPWSWRCRLDEAGLGVLGDITCHLVSVAHFLVGRITRLSAVTRTVYEARPVAEGRAGETRPVENEDVAHAIVGFENGAGGTLASSRAAWGRKCGLRFEVHGMRGMIAFDQERMNELELFNADDEPATRGFRRLLTGPDHVPYASFCPAPGHGLGFNELKTIELAELLAAIGSGEPVFADFERGLAIERVIHGMAASAAAGGWVELEG